MKTIYGINTSENSGQEYYELVEDLVRTAQLVMLPGGCILDVFPFLRHLPHWIPGMSIVHRIPEARESVKSALEKLDAASAPGVVCILLIAGRAFGCLLTLLLHPREARIPKTP